MSSNIYVVLMNIKGTRMFMYVVLHGTAQIPVGKAQNKAQNGFKRTCIGHQGVYI